MKSRILRTMQESLAINMRENPAYYYIPTDDKGNPSNSALKERLGHMRAQMRFIDSAIAGVRPDGKGLSVPYKSLEESMTTGDFPFALGEFVQRLMVDGYERKGFAFEPLVKPDTLPNFMAVTRYQQRAGADDLEHVAEKGQSRPGSRDDAVKRQYRVYKWEKQFDFSMESIVNDDLGYFNDQADAMGQAARRTLEKFVSRFYTNVVSIARLVALGANWSTTGRLTTARVSAARMAYLQRNDARGEPINARLKYIVHHSGLTDQAATILGSQKVAELATNAVNVTTFIPIDDPYIVGAAPNLPWYAFPDWRENNVIPFILARRSGVPAPILMRKKSDLETFSSFAGGGSGLSPMWGDFETGNIVLKVHDEWGTYRDGTDGNFFDTNGGYYSSGTAP